MKQLILSACFALISLYSFAQSENSATDTSLTKSDFRKARWGMSLTEVLAAEGNDAISKDPVMVMFKRKIADYDCILVYMFRNNALYQGTYLITQDFQTDNHALEAYQRLKELLTEKYGKPTSDASDWRNKLYQDNPDRYGYAIKAGHLTMSAKWELERTTAGMAIRSSDRKISIGLIYEGKKLAEEVKNEKKKADLGDL